MGCGESTAPQRRNAGGGWRRIVGPYGLLLASLVLLVIAHPIATVQLGRLPVYRLLVTLVLLTGVWASSAARRQRILGIGLGTASVLGNWLAELGQTLPFLLVGQALSVVFLTFVASAILRGILRERRVTTDTILGGISVYLLLAVIWMLVYAALESVSPGSFEIRGTPLSAEFRYVEVPPRSADLLYYSFVTITTLGYGDVIPVSRLARQLAALEAVAGQLFIAVFIARLVGLNLAVSAGPERD